MKKLHLVIVILLVILSCELVGYFWLRQHRPVEGQATYPEIQVIVDHPNWGFSDLATYFDGLAKAKGAKYAYEVLRIAPMPPYIDMHLMGHVVGDVLYIQQGAEGIKICTNDFRNACSHSIVVGMLEDQGVKGLEAIDKACQQAPGGIGAYNMCYHGLGHGVLAFNLYDMPKTIKMCGLLDSSAKRADSRASSECAGGAVMEILSGGHHDRETWQPQHDKYTGAWDPLAPCDQDYMPANYRVMCYSYLTPNLYRIAGATDNRPTDEQFKQAMKYCEKVPKSDPSSRLACFGAFGKEFVVFAQNLDVRNVDKLSPEKMDKVYNECLLTPDKDGQKSCLAYIVSAMFWGGDNDPHGVINFCSRIPDTELKSYCKGTFFGAVSRYIRGKDQQLTICGYIEDSQFAAECRKKFDTN